MYISELVVENFRCFGEGSDKLKLPLQVGLNTLVGENDAGKTAIIDALRMIFGTRDQESLRATAEDFHYSSKGIQAEEFSIKVLFIDLSLAEQGYFADYLTYQPEIEQNPVVLKITLNAALRNGKVRTTVFAGLPTSASGLKEIDAEVRDNLRATYLRPLRDAEKEMDAGRNSRISKILRKQSKIDLGENEIDLASVSEDKFGEVIDKIGVVGIARLVNQLLERQPAIAETTEVLNANFLKPLQMSGDNLSAKLGIGPDSDEEVLKKQMLEKIGISLDNIGGRRGLGSNNLLYIACEMLLLADSKDEPALLIIEEPEAHLHPQRQLKLIQYLQSKVQKHRDEHNVHLQVVLSTHSPTLASKLPIKCMTMVNKGRVLPFNAAGLLPEDDCIFLERFIDATKSNLFFCRGVMIVEGDAENLLVPSIAKLLGKDFTENGVSIVNVGHTGLSRYANIFSGTETYPNPGINVACLHDWDLIPFPAARELELESVKNKTQLDFLWDSANEAIKNGGIPNFEQLDADFPKNVISNFEGNTFDTLKIEAAKRNYKGAFVKGFYSGPWTLEYSLAYHGLAEEVTVAACLAKAEHSTLYDNANKAKIVTAAKSYYGFLKSQYADISVLAGKVYELFLNPVSVSDYIDDENSSLIMKKKASKAAAGQHLGVLLEDLDDKLLCSHGSKYDRIAYWKGALPDALVEAINHVTTAVSPLPLEGASDE
ncbi:AAA family ATPase [Pseudoalteromonas sp. B5MOD-1]|uniref:ATP-dependent nuclease n=1 Tax=Pseudoalteromonas sp. P80D2 TaxID=3113903 RepID=UPI002FCA24C2